MALADLRICQAPVTFGLMFKTFHPARTALIVLALLAQVGAVVVGACADTDCAMQPPAAGTIAAAGCCEAGCAGLVADETVTLLSEVLVNTPGVIAQVSFHILPAVRAPLAVTSPHQLARPRLHLFQLNQSYRL